MCDLSKDEIKARIRLEQVIEDDLGPPVKRYAAWQMYFCPFHENTRTPALGVNIQTGTFKCFSGACGVHGDIFTWHMLHNQVNFKTALAYFEQLISLGKVKRTSKRKMKIPNPSENEQPPSLSWQAQGMQFLEQCKVNLWNSLGKAGRKELLNRGIQLETARVWEMGYNPHWRKEPGAQWGFPKTEYLWLPRGLVIPSFVGWNLWGLKVRIFDKNGLPVSKATGKSKYSQIKGSHPALFGIDHWMHHSRLLLVESELDALLAWQEANELMDVASLGGASRHLSPHWILRLLPYSRIMVAYDQDQPGREGAKKLSVLSQRIKNSLPPANDLCDYYRQGGDLKSWLYKCHI